MTHSLKQQTDGPNYYPFVDNCARHKIGLLLIGYSLFYVA
jgi:hypothetical protein